MAKQVEQSSSNSNNQGAKKAANLYFAVETFDSEGKTVGTRIVDLYHFGTRDWLSGHNWWAMHQGHTVESRPATAEEIGAYLDQAKLALAEKFNSKKAA